MNLAIAYKIRYSDGRIDHAGDLEEAHQILIERYGKEVVYCDNGEAVPYPYEREIDNADRILVWANKRGRRSPRPPDPLAFWRRYSA